MHSVNEGEKKSIVEPYLSDVNTQREHMAFQFFDNGKPYSFDYALQKEFTHIITEIAQEQKNNPDSTLSPRVTNKLPIFLPNETRRIAFFAYKSKSVRAVDTDDLARLLRRQAKNMNLSPLKAKEYVKKDLEVFRVYQTEHDFDAYRMDVATTTIQFNAYNDTDDLLIEKSFVRGGLVFDMKPEEFEKKIIISYPRHRKQRSDKKTEYLPLKLIKIRGINLKEDQKSIS